MVEKASIGLRDNLHCVIADLVSQTLYLIQKRETLRPVPKNV